MRTMNKALRIITVLAISVIMVFAMAASSFAAETGHVNVSITKNNFNTSGQYVGGGSPATVDGVTLTDVAVNVAELESAIENDDFKYQYYLPSGVTDPMGGNASVLDAICMACEQNTISSIVTGWDSYNSPNGAYVSNIGNYDTTNTVTYFRGENNHKWARSTGSGWQIAYKPYGASSYTTSYSYYSNVALTDRMDIILDYSPYDMTWDTGQAWEE